ncbi:HlyD family secretion protein [Thalassoroseus pseudoceratinae]|uniref:hypothetical protein n=1 Tax=Thalassoroseus pseudoceratinae TaxID=2713176 RepID=UPI00141F61A9|nr:hypothetical protein [Thalassoroseus pseudoceratinae]
MSTRRFSLLLTPITLPCLILVGWLSVPESSGANQDAADEKPLVIELRNQIELAEIQVAIREQMVKVAEAEATADPAEILKTEAELKAAKVALESSIKDVKRVEALFIRGATTASEKNAANAMVSHHESRIGVLEAQLKTQKKPSRADVERIRLLELKAKKARIKLDHLRQSLKRFLSSISGPALP